MRTVTGLVLAALLVAGPALGQCPQAAGSAPEAWALSCLKQGMEADFDVQCGKADPLRPNDQCRELSHGFIEDIATSTASEGAIPHQGIRLRHALVKGDVDLRDATISQNISIEQSRIDGAMNISRARFAFGLSLTDSVIAKAVEGDGTRFGRDLRLERTTTAGVNLIGADIDGFVQFSGLNVPKSGGLGIVLNNARIRGDLVSENVTASRIQGLALDVGGNADLGNQRSEPYLDLADAKIGVDLSLSGELGGMRLDSIHVSSTLHMNSAHTHGVADLRGAQIDKYLDISDSRFDGDIMARALHVMKHAKIVRTTVNGQVNFKNASFDGDLLAYELTVSNQWIGTGMHVAGTLDTGTPEAVDPPVNVSAPEDAGLSEIMSETAAPPLDLSHAHIGESLRLTNTRLSHPVKAASPGAPAAKWRPVNMKFVQIGSDFDLSTATLSGLDLFGAKIGAEFRLSDNGSKTCWQAKRAARAGKVPGHGPLEECGPDSGSRLILINAHTDTLVLGNLDAWPEQIDLTGFGFNHTGEGPPNGQVEMWQQWLARDKFNGKFKAQPYAQLATVMTAEGDRDSAAAIQYQARNEALSEAWANGEWRTYIPLAALRWLAGYGIGDYTWRALYWVIGLTTLGTILVYYAQDLRNRRLFWSMGASLEKVVPYVRLDPSFTAFFERQEGFKWWHKLVFGVLALIGSALGLFLAAAASGLTQKG